MTGTTSKTTTRKPAGAKQPQDRQPKAPAKPAVKSVDGGHEVTYRGVTITIADGALDDFELLEDVAAADSGDAMRLPSLLRRLAGDDGFRAVMDGLRNPDTGKVSIESASEFVDAVFGALNPNS